MKPAVAVLGASGQVGLFAVAGLLETGRQVIAVTRQAAGSPETGLAGLRRSSLQQLAVRLNGPGSHPCALLSCGPVALAREFLEVVPGGGGHPWERFVVVGTTSTLSKRSSENPDERRLVGEIESTLAAIRRHCANHAIPLTILHPTLIYGCGMDQNLSRVYRWIRRLGIAPVADQASGLRQPLHVADLASTLIKAVQAEPAPQLESAVCGGSRLEYRDMVAKLFDAAGRRRRFLRLPEAAFGPVAALSALLPGAGRINREMFRRQSDDLVFDDRPAREKLGHAPRPFQPTEADFQLPPDVERIRSVLV